MVSNRTRGYLLVPYITGQVTYLQLRAPILARLLYLVNRVIKRFTKYVTAVKIIRLVEGKVGRLRGETY